MTARFVILHHRTTQGEHWDFMVERGDVLATWQLLADPRRDDAWPIDAIRIGDHRLDYLTYEGPLSGGRGNVIRIDAGTCEILRENSHSLDMRLWGIGIEGSYALLRVDKAQPDHWKLVHHHVDE